MKKALIIRHVAFEDLGYFAPLLEQAGYHLQYGDATSFDFAGGDACTVDLLIILGGPIGVYDGREYPFLNAETAYLKQRLAADKAILGICLGCQLIAHALGAKVYPSGHVEIGWKPVQLTPAGNAGCLRALADKAVLHWHGDTFDLPAGAELLASSDLCKHQAFSMGNSLALQFHPEITAAGMERWFVGHTHEIHSTQGLSVEQLRADTRQYAPALEQAGKNMLSTWLESLP